MYVGNLLLLIINLPAVPLFIKAVQLPPTILVPIVVGIALAGTYSIRNNMFDVGVVIAAGAVGFLLRRFDYPVAPLVLALVLGPLAERSLRQSLQMSQGNAWILLDRPVSLALLIAATAAVLLRPALRLARRSRKAHQPLQRPPAS